MSPFWVTAFVDLPADDVEAGTAFWSAVTGFDPSPARGAHGEFATLVPPDGDAYLRVQRLDHGPARIHVDLHVDDAAALADRAVGLGAVVVARPPEGYAVLASPAGVTFCAVRGPAAVRPRPAVWAGARSVVDQVCLDIAPGAYEAECVFWRDLTGWELREGSVDGFRSLARPAGQPVRLMLQRVGDDRRPATAHLDLACDDREAETARHVGLGATVRGRQRVFTGLTDPIGASYCLTDRDVETGLIGTRVPPSGT